MREMRLDAVLPFDVCIFCFYIYIYYILYRENTLYINTLCGQTKDQNVKFTCVNNGRSQCGNTRFLSIVLSIF